MEPKPTIRDLTERNVEHIAEMEFAAQTHRTAGERVADSLVYGMGSWTFLIVQSVFLVIWMIVNVIAWQKAWDPYPFVLLNLVLSFQAAYAAPIILMSENRQARLAERRHHLDLQINLLAEQENTEQLQLLRLLCQKAGITQTRPLEHALEEQTDPKEIVDQIKKRVEAHKSDG